MAKKKNDGEATIRNPLDAAVDEVNGASPDDGSDMTDATESTASETLNTNGSSNEDREVKRLKAIALFEEYRRLNKMLNDAKKLILTHSEARSDIVKKLHAILGNEKFRFDGLETSIVSKDNETTGKSSWFFRVKSKEKEGLPEF